MDFTVRIYNDTRFIEHKVKKDTNLLEFLRHSGYDFDFLCGGHGICGKCKVRVCGQILPKVSDEELRFLGEASIQQGFRLACMISVNTYMSVYLDNKLQTARIVTDGKHKAIKLSPCISKKFISLSPPTLQDQRSDAQRLADDASISAESFGLDSLKSLPDILRDNDFKVTVVSKGSNLIAIEEGDTTKHLYGIAVDLGTTTIAAYLVDLGTGRRLSTYSSLNPQRKYGADVITRIKYTVSESDGLVKMHSCIIYAVNEAVKALANNANIKKGDVYHIVFAGNTTMMHFLLNICAFGISVAPFIPVFTGGIEINAAEIGIDINKNAVATIIPSVSAYIGADTVSAVIASGLDSVKENCLLIDFGTNGEIVLANGNRLLACSAAAGPAFEGANIRCGIGSVRGAIDSFIMDKGLSFTTIDDAKATGICGTGLIDIVSELLRTGIIDETGRFCDADSLAGENEIYSERLIEIDGQPAFLIASLKETSDNEGIYITQKDVRELQNAKAAIAAGIQVLVKRADISFDDISNIYLAGGFGSFIKVKSALNIGLIPKQFCDKIESIGNAAGLGALMALLSNREFSKTDSIRKRIEYIELSAERDFSDLFVDAMMFNSGDTILNFGI